MADIITGFYGKLWLKDVGLPPEEEMDEYVRGGITKIPAQLRPAAPTVDFDRQIRAMRAGTKALRHVLLQYDAQLKTRTRVSAAGALAAAKAYAVDAQALALGGGALNMVSGGPVALAVKSAEHYARFLEAFVSAPTQMEAMGGGGGETTLRGSGVEQQTRHVEHVLASYAEVARAAHLLSQTPAPAKPTEAFADAVDKAMRALRIFARARNDGDGDASVWPEAHIAKQATVWCRLAVARAAMDTADTNRAARPTHSLLRKALAWAHEAVRGRAFSVLFSTTRETKSLETMASRAEKISIWYCRASDTLDDKGAKDMIDAVAVLQH